tara:strand:- start:562 stop:1422 length:861 start_codon:yes stop_codon:yes gene_type:complete
MPELPEVEIVKQSLKSAIKYKKISQVIVKNRNLRFKVPIDFERSLRNKVVLNISRISKYIIIEFKSNLYCVFHLGMSGTIHLIKKKIDKVTNLSFYQYKQVPKKHNHLKFVFSKFSIIYNDPRRFGFFKLFRNLNDLNLYFKKIGPEPFSKNFNVSYLFKKIQNKKKNIKNILLDQNIIGGLGNIYVNEILYYSKINPKKKGSQITKSEIKKIIRYSKIVLKLAIKYGGSSIRDFQNTEGLNGSFQKEFKIYGRKGEICSRNNCKGIITKFFQTNRSTYMCETCQK